MDQLSIFDFISKPLKITKPIRLIELFAGYGSQALALKRLQNEGKCKFEHYKVCEFDEKAIQSYNIIHDTNFTASDIRMLKGEDLGIIDKETFTYLLTYLLIPLSRFINRW